MRSSAPSIAGQSDDGRRLEVVDEQIARADVPRPRAAARSLRRSWPARRPAAGGRAGRPRGTRPGWRAVRGRARSRTRAAASAGSGSTISPAPVPSARPGSSWRGHVGPEPAATPRASSGATGRQRGGQPQRGGGVGRAAAHAGRDRDPLDDLDPHRRRRPSRARRLGERVGGQVVALDARAVRPRSLGPRTASVSVSSSASDTDSNTVTSSWRPSARVRPSNRQRLTLPGASARSFIAPQPSRASSANSSGESRSARASGGQAERPAARPAPRSTDVRVGAPPAAAPATRQRLAAVGERVVDERAAARGDAGPPRRAQAEQHRVDVGDRAEHRARRPARSTLTSQASWASTERHAVGAACRARPRSAPPPRAGPSPPSGATLGSSLDRAQDRRWRRRRRAGWRPSCPGRACSSSRSKRERVADVQARRWRTGASASRRPASQPLVDLDHVQVSGERGEPLGQHALAAADLQHDVVGRDSSASRSITSRMFAVDEEVLAERPGAGRLQAGPSEHGRRVRSTAARARRSGTRRSTASACAVCATT